MSLLKRSIISKLKEVDAYIDDELPEYILVMIANKKTIHQMAIDLQLFLGDGTDKFIQWLQKALNDPDSLTQNDSLTSSHSPVQSKIGSKRSNSPLDEGESQHLEEPVSSSSLTRPSKIIKKETPPTKVQRIRLPPEEPEKPTERKRDNHGGTEEPRRTRDQDLRNLIRTRKAETQEDKKRGGVPSIVHIPDKPERPKESRGTSRLLQRAIHDIHGKRKKGSTASSREDKKIPHRAQSDESEGNAEMAQIVQSTNFVDEFFNEDDSNKEEVMDNDDDDDEGEGRIEERGGNNDDDDEDEDDDIEVIQENPATEEEIEAATLAAIKKVLPRQKTDLRLLLNRGKEKNSKVVKNSQIVDNNDSKTDDAQSESTRFVVTMQGLDSDQPEDDTNDSKQNKAGLTERCKFWPNCKNGDNCIYHHPTVPCRLFPNCKYGQKCCFVHPICKFDGRCMKSECPYLHTVPKVKNIIPSRMASPFSRLPYMYGSPPMYNIGGGAWSKTRYPDKQSLKWTPTKQLNDRKFAVSDSETTSMPV